MKKLSAFFLAVMMIFSLAACGSTDKPVLTIEGTPISGGIYAYYLNKVAQRPVDYGLDETADRQELKQAAIAECKRYVVTNTSFINKGLSLTASQKVEISHTVNDYWLRFENHYNEIGVSKQTLTKVTTAEAYREVLFSAEYDKGTGDAEAEKILKDYFYDNHIAFRNICVYYTAADGKSDMTELEKVQLLEAINALAAQAGDDVEEFSQTVTNAGYTLSDSSVLKKGADTYPEGFYEKVEAQDDGTVQVITYDECVFVVWKESLEDKGESVYANYRSQCITDLYQNQAKEKTSEYISSLKVEEESGIDKITDKVI